MDIGVCLPTNFPDLEPERLLEWSLKAEALGFSTLASTDRFISARYEPLLALTAAAAVTTRVRLLTAVLVSPLQTNAVMLAKQVATLDRISAGRLTLGVGVGSHEAEYELSGANFHRRGRILDRQIDTMRAVWSGEHGVGPPTDRDGGPDILIGGYSPAAFDRVARTHGWIAAAAAGPITESRDQLLETWTKAGRVGKPRVLVLGNFSLGPDAQAQAQTTLTYAYGPQRAEAMIGRVPQTAGSLREFAASFEAEGCDELILSPCAQDLNQLDLLAEAMSLTPPRT